MSGPRIPVLLPGALLAALTSAQPSVPARTQPTAVDPPRAVLDVIALDSSGRAITNLSAADFRVLVDGRLRETRSAHYVFRGPGASNAAAALAGATRTPVRTDPSRLILLVADERSMVRGAEEPVIAAAWRVLDTTAASDRVGVVTVPVPRGEVTISDDRRAVREAVAGLEGRAPASRDLARADHSRPEPEVPVIDDDPEPAREQPIAGRAPLPPGTTPSPAGAPLGASDAAEELAPTSLDALASLLSDLRDVPGPKHVVYLWAGVSSWRTRASAAATVETAAQSRTTVHVVSLARSSSDDEATLERLARDTGGTFTRWKGKDRRTDTLSAALSGSYLVEFEGQPDDAAARPRAVKVSTSRKGVTLLAAVRWVSRDDPLPAIVEPPSHPAAGPSGGATPTPVPGGSAATAAGRRNPELDAVLARMSEYLDTYLKDFSNVVAEEDYHQRWLAWNSTPREIVHLRSDLLLVRTGDRDGWTPFRDVFEVNNVPVRDRQDRLRRLFLERPGAAMAEARRITEEGARYNIGPIERTINLPTLPLLFLGPSRLPSFTFERRGEDTVEGLSVLRIDYEEVGRPTVIRDRGGVNRPSVGSLWVDPATGRVVKTSLRNSGKSVRLDATVLYRRSDALGLWVPAEMSETYRMLASRESVVGSAKYSNFRRFAVDTEVTISAPKPERRP